MDVFKKWDKSKIARKITRPIRYFDAQKVIAVHSISLTRK